MSDSGASGVWSSEQLSWLQALGHTVYLDRAGAADSFVDGPDTTAPPADQAQGAPMMPATARRAPAPPATEHSGPVAPATAPPRRGRVGLPDRLQLALLRASGLNPSDPATQAVMDTWPLAELRGNPRAKRALWPQLRALRRKAPRP